MEIREIQVADDPRELPIIVLHEKHGDRHFPVFIGHYEGHTLDEAVRHSIQPADAARRPFAHDLMLNLVDGLSARFTRVLITRLENSTYYGALELTDSSGNTIIVDSRPSDAMILAVKRQIPIFVEETVLAEADNSQSQE